MTGCPFTDLGACAETGALVGWRRLAALVSLLVLAGCTSATPGATGGSVPPPGDHPGTSTSSSEASALPTSVPIPATAVPSTARPRPAPTPTSTKPLPAGLATPGGSQATFSPTGSGPLDGKVVAVDPGHNGDNFADPSYINQMIWNGREEETCDTTGTETPGGYTESLFNWNVAQFLTAALRAAGATVVLTRTNNVGVGPCVTERAAIGNQAKADAAVSVHADGGPAYGRGFAILIPVADGPNDAIAVPSRVLGEDLRDEFAMVTGEPVSNYDGVDGIQPRDDLAGTNLSTVPKVFIECANMRNTADAALVSSVSWQAQAAAGITAGLEKFLTSTG